MVLKDPHEIIKRISLARDKSNYWLDAFPLHRPRVQADLAAINQRNRGSRNSCRERKSPSHERRPEYFDSPYGIPGVVTPSVCEAVSLDLDQRPEEEPQ